MYYKTKITTAKSHQTRRWKWTQKFPLWWRIRAQKFSPRM